MQTPNDIEVLERSLRAHFPPAQLSVDVPVDGGGTWYVDVRHERRSLTIQWRSKHGFGLSASHGAFGEGADEIYSSVTEVVSRVAELLGISDGR
jgi:hypothetical protein